MPNSDKGDGGEGGGRRGVGRRFKKRRFFSDVVFEWPHTKIPFQRRMYDPKVLNTHLNLHTNSEWLFIL